MLLGGESEAGSCVTLLTHQLLRAAKAKVLSFFQYRFIFKVPVAWLACTSNSTLL